MFATTVSLPQFGRLNSKRIISGLTSLRDEIQVQFIPGLVSADLFREQRGDGAFLLICWRRKRDLATFLESPSGRAAAKRFAGLVSAESIGLRSYYRTWDAERPKLSNGRQS